MNVTSFVSRVIGRFATAGLLGAALIASVGVVPASAQYGRPSYDRNTYRQWRVSRADVVRIAQANGYSEGFESGLTDRANRGRMSYQSRREYTEATQGYRTEWGQLPTYQASYRQAYARGYQDAFNGRSRNRSFDRARVYRDYSRYGYDPYYNYPSYRTGAATIALNTLAERAANQGFEDGFLRGQYDRNIGVRRPNPRGHGAYEHALNGWDPEWGGASTFQSYYRTYFEQGYRQGYGGRRTGFVFRPR
jgi:hypothetical protein